MERKGREGVQKKKRRKALCHIGFDITVDHKHNNAGHADHVGIVKPKHHFTISKKKEAEIERTNTTEGTNDASDGEKDLSFFGEHVFS